MTPRPSLFTPGKEIRYPFYSIVQEPVRTSGPVWTGRKNLVLAGFRSPDCPANDTFLLNSKWHKEHLMILSFIMYLFQICQELPRQLFITSIHHVHQKNFTNSSTRLNLTIREKIICSKPIFIVKCIYIFLCIINTKCFSRT